MKTVVFGGSGFLGGHVAKELSDRGHDVIIADIKLNESSQKHQFIECNILHKDQLEQLITHEIDYVYNFAGMSNLGQSVKDPLNTINLNVQGNLNILDACKDMSVKRYVYASSAYALSNKGSFYGISKLTSEKLIEEYKKQYNLPYTIIRYGSIYGELNYENNYLYHIIKDAIYNKRIIHDTDGGELREYIHVADAATLSVDILETAEYIDQHIVLTGIERMQKKDLFLLIKEILNDDVEISLNNKEAHEDYHYRITPYSFSPKTGKKLVMNPYIDLGQGILKCIESIHNDKS